MASDISRKIETADRALESLFGVMEGGQAIEIAYRGGMADGRATFSLQVQGKSQGATAREAADNARRLRQNLSLALGAQPGLRFGDGTPQQTVDRLASPRWIGRVHPQGMLVSAHKALKILPQDAPPFAVLISPAMAAEASSLSLIDTVLASPQTIEVIVSIKPYCPGDEARQGLASILQAMGMGKAAYLMLPERRKASAEECEFLLGGLEHQIKRWLTHPSGIELGCTVHAAERPSEALLAMIGKVLFPNQRLALSIKPPTPDSLLSRANDEESGALDLRSCINSTWGFPAFFPHLSQLADAGAKRCYPVPAGGLDLGGLRMGVAGGREVCLTQADRSRHTYITGATGSGKSTLLFNMIAQDIADGEGVCLIDPHGDLYRDVLDAIPPGRAKDVVLFDPCDFDYAVGLNFLECDGPHPQVRMNLVSNEMIKIFDRLYDLRQTGGPMFELYMRNALLLAMDNDTPGTLMDVPRIFEDKAHRDHLKRICKNPLVVRFWGEQAERAGGDTALANITPYITSKLNQFTHNALLRPIIGQSKSTLDFRAVMDNRQILLVNLSKGLLGELDSQLLGMLLIGKLFFAAIGRAGVLEARRVPFHWYIDEFQNFTTDTLAQLLSESRKFGIRLTLANQNLAQLNQAYGRENLMEAVLGNVGNLLFFRTGAADAERLATYTRPELDAQDLQYLPDFHAAARLLRHNEPLRPFVLQTLPKQKGASTGWSDEKRRRFLENCHRRHARPVAEVEEEIRVRAGLPPSKNADVQTATREGKSALGLDDLGMMTHAELLVLPIAQCDRFTVRTRNFLRTMGVDTFKALVGHTDQALSEGGVGRRSLAEIREVLGELGLVLAEGPMT